MFNEIWVCLDGSALAEKILPLAQSVANASGGTITLLRVLENDRELSAAESYMREQARVCGGTIKFLVSENPASAIVHELEIQPRALVAITTHGRTGWAEAILGSIALQVVRDSGRPVLLYRPQTNAEEAPKKIDTLALALDGSEFSEKIIHYAAEMAKALNARLLLIQALPLQPPVAGSSDQKSIIPFGILLSPSASRHDKARPRYRGGLGSASRRCRHGDLPVPRQKAEHDARHDIPRP
ncbi:MAG: universal stress protein [Candidatus Binatia bacterium]